MACAGLVLNTPAALVLNTRAGTLVDRPELPGLIEAALRSSGFDLRVVPDDHDIDERLDDALSDPDAVVIVGGGDGTLRAAAARLAGTGRTLGILALGTRNLLAKDLNLPLDPEEAAATLARAEVREIDLGEVNGHIFTCQSILGAPSAVFARKARARRDSFWRKQLAMFRGLVSALRHPPLRLAC